MQIPVLFAPILGPSPLRATARRNVPALDKDLPQCSGFVINGDFVPGEMKTDIPLQAADLICWHLQCRYRGGFARTGENRMWYLLKGHDGDLHEWSKEELEDFANALRVP